MLSLILRRSFAFAALFGLLGSPAFAGGAAGLDPANLDRSVAPGTDFYRYAVGGWLARNAIPADRTSWGAFDEVQKRNERRLIDILRSPSVTDAPVGSERRKIGDLYAACTDEPGVESAGLSALRPTLAGIAALSSRSGLVDVLASAQFTGNDAGFGFGPESDPKDARRVIASISQGGLSLPTPDYYSSSTGRSKAIRAAFVRRMRSDFRLLGQSDAAAATSAANVFGLEARMARISKSPDQLRDPIANFHPMSLAALDAASPHFAWPRFFAKVGVDARALGRIDVNQPAFVRGFDALVQTVPLETWRDYVRWHVLKSQTVALPKAYRDAAFAFNRVYSGQPVQTPRERTCSSLVDGTLGFALGNAYVARYFPPSARMRARAEIASIKTSLKDDIEHVAWMGPKTRAAALAKLAKLSTAKVGYPDRPRSYATLAISRADLLGDVLAGARFDTRRAVAKIGKPVDRSEWGLTPQTVNAYYDPSMNEIVIPAGILEAPFFDANASDAVNFGGIGAVIGHELTHGFDDEGSQFDGNGNLNAIVTPADAVKFHARVACIVKQADSYTVASLGLHLNGKLDAGEATADVGGTTLAYRALRSSIGGSATSTNADTLTPDQAFFLSWAQVWREKDRPQAERAQVLGDPHPVSAYRVNATLSNEPAFYTAFGVKVGDAMYRSPAQRCAVW